MDRLAPEPRDAYLWDRELAGFGVKITPAGKRVYLVQYRIGGRNGRTRRVTIGQHGDLWTPEKARRVAKKLLGEVAAGRDPARERDSRRSGVSLRDAASRFLESHAQAKRKASTAREYGRLLKLHILPNLGSRLVADIDRADVLRLHHGMADTPYQANRVIAVLSNLFTWADASGLRTDGRNPCRGIEKFKESARERLLSDLELAALGEALADAEAKRTATPWAIGAIRLLLFTGARLNEILAARRDWMETKRGVLRLPDSKTGAKSIYLNAPALEVMAGLPELQDNPFLICGEKAGAHLVNLEKPWRRLRAAATVKLWAAHSDSRLAGLIGGLRGEWGREPTLDECREAASKELPADYKLPAGLLDVRLHDLRHAYASVGAIGGLGLPVIGALLGHSQPSLTHRDAHLSADPLRAASEAIANRIAGAMSGREGKVVPLPKRAG